MTFTSYIKLQITYIWLNINFHFQAEIVLDPTVHMIIWEDNAMINSGTFFIKKSQWSLDLMRIVYGDDTSVWIDHPW